MNKIAHVKMIDIGASDDRFSTMSGALEVRILCVSFKAPKLKRKRMPAITLFEFMRLLFTIEWAIFFAKRDDKPSSFHSRPLPIVL